MVSCETPYQKLNYVFSCHLLAQVQIKIGKLEGERKKPDYKEIIESPILNYSGAFQHLDLYVTAQIFANNQELCMPVKTSYKYIEKEPWIWDEWLTLPLRISDLPRNALLVITAWDIESPKSGDVPVCGSSISLFDRYGEFRQGSLEIRLWPNRVGDGNSKSTTPGLLSDQREFEIEEMIDSHQNSDEAANLGQANGLEEFPMLDELDRLAKLSKFYADGHMIKQEWLDNITLQKIENTIKNEKKNSKFFFMNVELAQIECDNVKYKVLYYEENAERIVQVIPNNDLFVVNDPELELDNIIESKNRKLEHTEQMVLFDMNLKPDTDSKNQLHKIINYPMTRPLKREEQTLLWNYRYYLTQNKKALSKFLQCFDLNLEFEGNTLMELMLKWQPMDIEDALELLGSKYKNYPKIRSYAISRLKNASNEDLILYLLQLVQALRYENFSSSNTSNIKSITTSGCSNSTAASAMPINISSNISSSSIKQPKSDDYGNNFAYSSSPPLASQTIIHNRNLLNQIEPLNTFELNLKSFLLERATKDEIVALCLYWFLKVEINDSKVLSSSASTINLFGQSSSLTNAHASSSSSNLAGTTNQYSNNLSARTNFQIFMDELLENLRDGDQTARSIYNSIINQEKFLKALNEIVKAVSREEGRMEKKLNKLISLLKNTEKSSFDLMNLDAPIPLIIDPSIKIYGIDCDKTKMFKSNLMPCKFVFKALPSKSFIDPEYSVIYKIGDDLRQDQLILQMIALMDKLLKQENLDLKLSPYKVIATGVKEGFLQFVDAVPVSNILNNSEYRSIREFLKKNNPSSTDKYGIKAEAMDNYVKSSAGYIVITYILGIGDRHYDNILITRCGKIVHIDFGYILGQDPKLFQPTIKWTKDFADGMGGIYGSDGKENKEYEDFKKYCCNAFLQLRRHANLILNLFSLMIDANIPGIALEPDKTVKKLIDKFKLDLSDEQAQYSLIKEIENNYGSLVGNITDVIHHYNTNRK
uniref:Phosphatidylinositol 3-kinase catalytic subunit type 3 n=1 Tax=Brachionus koreanus TaxID=1199090 RepID=A0A2Z4EUK9_9BILA|nr:phosphatidylinositol 3-kinase catalytic subunit type 3 isoform X1 [Brachionus koreanus]